MQTLEIHSPEATNVARRAFNLREAAALCGRSYHTLYRAACRGELRVLSGFGRMMVSDKELNRFLGKSEIYRGKRAAKQEATV